jgi:hypothetical protein
VVRIFLNREACLRLVTSLCVEQSEEWVTGRRYLDIGELQERRRGEREVVKGVMLVERYRGDSVLGGNYRNVRT